MNHDPEWIKVVDQLGLVRHINWTDNYLALRTQSGYGPPGLKIFLNYYLIIFLLLMQIRGMKTLKLSFHLVTNWFFFIDILPEITLWNNLNNFNL